MASDALFLALSQALSQPSKSFRAVQAGGQAGQDILGGYMQGNQIRASRTEAKLKPYEIYTNIADKIGPDRANAIFKQIGMPVPQVAGESSSVGIDTPPEQLLGQGIYGQRMLQGRNMLDEMKKRDLEAQNNAPYTSEIVRAVLKDNPNLAEGLISAHKGQPIPYREVQNAISTIRPNMMGGYFGAKAGALQLGQLPSQMGPQTAAGAAYQVQLAAHQGKALIASPGAYQRLGMTQGDAARALLRNSPTDEAMRNANFSDTAIGRFNKLKAALSSDPTQIDQPLMRKGLYDALDEMEKSSKPYIANHLANMEANGSNSTFGDNWGATKQREMGLNVSDVPFDMGTGSVQNPNISTGVPQVGGTFGGGKVLHVEKISP